MTFGALLRFVGLTIAVASFGVLIAVIYEIPVALFTLLMAVLGLCLYCVGCLIPEPIDDSAL